MTSLYLYCKADSADTMMSGETAESVHGTQPVLTGAVRTQVARTAESVRVCAAQQPEEKQM